MIPDLNIKAVITRSVTVEDYAFTVDDDPASTTFMVSLASPTLFKANDGSPRELDPYTLRWMTGLLGPSVIPQAGWRVTLTRPNGRSYENLEYELLADPREFRVGPATHGIQAEASPVGVLYPIAATLKEQAGTTVGPFVGSLWSDREDHADTGTYERFSGETPVEFADELGNNRWLDIGGKRYRITSSIMDYEGPRVKFEARRSNA